MEGYGLATLGTARQARRGVTSQGLVGLGMAGVVRSGTARQGIVCGSAGVEAWNE